MRVLSVPLVGFSRGRREASGQSDQHLGRELTFYESQEELVDSIAHVGVELMHLSEASDCVVLWRRAEVYRESLAVRPNNLLVLLWSYIVESHVVTHVNLCSIDRISNLAVERSVR